MAKVVVPKPPEKTWASSVLHRVYLGMKARAGMAGLRLVWVVIGYKWVRLCTPITHIKHRIRRIEWDSLSPGDRKRMGKDK